MELWDDTGHDTKGAMIGDWVPPASDYVLRSQFLDQSRARSVVGYALARALGRWAPHTRYVELFIQQPTPPPAFPASPEQGESS